MNLPPKTQALILNGASKGERNTTLFNLCCQWRDSGMTQDRAYDEAEVWALRNGLGHKEAEGCIRSTYTKPARERWEPRARYSLNGHNGLTIVKNDMPVPPMPTSVEETPVAMFLSAAFELGENINICRGIKDGDRERPNGTGETKTREEWLKTFEDGGLVDWQGSAVGVYVSINPNNGNGRKGEDVVKWRHVLIEFDDSTLEEQWKIIKKSGLPTSCIIKSGGRSLHAWVRIDAANEAEFHERVAFIFKNLEHGKPDSSTKDAGRLSRLPGAMRTSTGKQQELVECGAPSLTYMEWMEGKIYGDIPEPYKWDDLVKFDENADPTVLLGKRWLCRGGSSLWVGSSGLGKSVLCLQAAMTWGAARNLFGITSHNKGLKSLIVQAENDEGDVAEALQGILTALNLSPEELEQVKSNIVIVRDCTSTGERFVDRMRRLVEKHKPHLVWVDPLLAFIGGDLSSQETASGFLRNMLNPLALSAGFAWMLMHHTPKPMRDGTSYQGHDKAYSGFGSSELTNWARSVLTLGPCGQNEDGTYVYKLEVSKRGKRSGLHTGKTARDCIATNVQPFVYLKHADKGMAWIEADAPEKKKPGPKAEEVDWSRCNVMPCSWADLVRWVEKTTGKSGTTATRYIANGKDQDYLCEVNGMYQLNKAKNDQPF
jgi:RecA-family ATPase